MQAFGYLRTSSATNVGEDKDSDTRQKAAITAGANRLGYEIVDWFYDAGITGDMPVTDRPAFTALLDRIESNGVRTVFVESADRFARKMLIAETGLLVLIARQATMITSTGEDLTNTDDEMRVAFRQIAMVFAQLEKTRLVKKLRGARDRKSEAAGRRIEGQKGYTRGNPELVRIAKTLTGPLLSKAAQLQALGYVTAKGNAFSASQVQRLLDAQDPA